MTASAHNVTALLHAWTAGDSAARDQLMTVVYEELRRRAAGQLRGERRGHTLQPTALVHEAYVRLVDQRRMVWQFWGAITARGGRGPGDLRGDRRAGLAGGASLAVEGTAGGAAA